MLKQCGAGLVLLVLGAFACGGENSSTVALANRGR